MIHDAIAAVIHSSDQQGKYLDEASIEQLKPFLQPDDLKVEAAQRIREHAAAIVKEAVTRSLSHPELLRPSGSLQATRYYAAYVRDLDFFLRYATYALLADDTAILEQRVLKGLKEMYQSLGVTLTVTTDAIQLLKVVTAEVVGVEAGQAIGGLF